MTAQSYRSSDSKTSCHPDPFLFFFFFFLPLFRRFRRTEKTRKKNLALCSCQLRHPGMNKNEQKITASARKLLSLAAAPRPDGAALIKEGKLGSLAPSSPGPPWTKRGPGWGGCVFWLRGRSHPSFLISHSDLAWRPLKPSS